MVKSLNLEKDKPIMAFLQVAVLIFGIFAFAHAFGSSVGFVSGQDGAGGDGSGLQHTIDGNTYTFIQEDPPTWNVESEDGSFNTYSPSDQGWQESIATPLGDQGINPLDPEFQDQDAAEEDSGEQEDQDGTEDQQQGDSSNQQDETDPDLDLAGSGYSPGSQSQDSQRRGQRGRQQNPGNSKALTGKGGEKRQQDKEFGFKDAVKGAQTGSQIIGFMQKLGSLFGGKEDPSEEEVRNKLGGEGGLDLEGEDIDVGEFKEKYSEHEDSFRDKLNKKYFEDKNPKKDIKWGEVKKGIKNGEDSAEKALAANSDRIDIRKGDIYDTWETSADSLYNDFNKGGPAQRNRDAKLLNKYYENGGDQAKTYTDLSGSQAKTLNKLSKRRYKRLSPEERAERFGLAEEKAEKSWNNLDDRSKVKVNEETKTDADKSGGLTKAGSKLTGSAGNLGFFQQVKQGLLKGQGTGAGTDVGNAAYITGATAVAFAAAELYVLAFKTLGSASPRNVKRLQTGAYAVGGAALAASSLLAGLENVAAPAGAWGAAAAVVAMGIYTLFSYKTKSHEVYNFQVSPWQPPEGGSKCTQCNELRYGCSEYQCHTFGTACELVNKGGENQKCIWKNKGDQEPPIMSPMNSTLGENQEYDPMNVESPKGRGVKIVSGSGECLPPFSGAKIGLHTNEVAKCKLDIERKKKYEDMSSMFSEGNVYVKNHTIQIPGAAMPSQEASSLSDFKSRNGETNRFYARCKDVNGNPTPVNFVFGYCVQEGPDTQAPIIEGTNIPDGKPVGHNTTSLSLDVYTNEPATCRWSRTDLRYADMKNGFQDCSMGPNDYLLNQNNKSFQYGCRGQITGIDNNQENKYYIKCKDKPWKNQSDTGKRFENKESFELTIKGSKPLVINNVSVNGWPSGSVINDATDTIKATISVKTSAGAQRGKAVCRYTIDGDTFKFYNNGTQGFVPTNTQDLYLSEGSYQIPINCNDAGNNADSTVLNFSIDQDQEEPSITRAYYDVENLKVLTSEPAECAFSTNPNVGCTYAFEDADKMEDIEQTTHYTGWEPNQRYYVKCRDEFGNLPEPDQCSIEVKAYSG